MKLNGPNTRLCRNALNHLWPLFIDEDPNAQHFARQLPDDAARLCWRDIPRAAAIEIEAERIGPSLNGRAGVFKVGDAADLD